jgi:CubicO group peptidase (beta-lactamase class C family)
MKIKTQIKFSIFILQTLFITCFIIESYTQPQHIVNSTSYYSDFLNRFSKHLLLTGNDGKRFRALDSIINKSIADSAFPGAVILVQKDRRIIYEKAFGYYTYDTASGKVSINTLYDLASLTKVVATTTATMICYDRGLFKIDDKVSKYLPKFGVNGKENITIRNLLVHDSGLRPDIPSYRIFDSVVNKEQGVMNEIFNDTLIYPTGAKMVYSDLNFILMGKIIEKATGMSLDNFCNKSIFEPLGMNSTMFNPPKSIVNRIAPTEYDDYWRHRQIRGTVHDETSQLLNGVAGHAGLFSTAGDLAKLLQMLLQKGVYQGRSYIKASTVEMFLKKQSDLSSRALGWDTKSPEHSSAGNLFNNISYGHTGFTGTSVWTDPTRKLFVIFLTNRVYPTRNNSKIFRVRPKVHNAVIEAIEEKRGY